MLNTFKFITPLALCVTCFASLSEAAYTESSVVESYSFDLLEMPTSEFLSLLAQKGAYRLNVSPQIRSTLSGVTYQGDLRKIITEVALDKDLDYFSFNGVTYFSDRREAATQIIPLRGLSQTQARIAMDVGGLDAGRFPFDFVADGTALSLSGPPQLIGIVDALLRVTPSIKDKIENGDGIVVRRGVMVQTEVPFSQTSASPPAPEDS